MYNGTLLRRLQHGTISHHRLSPLRLLCRGPGIILPMYHHAGHRDPTDADTNASGLDLIGIQKVVQTRRTSKTVSVRSSRPSAKGVRESRGHIHHQHTGGNACGTCYHACGNARLPNTEPYDIRKGWPSSEGRGLVLQNRTADNSMVLTNTPQAQSHGLDLNGHHRSAEAFMVSEEKPILPTAAVPTITRQAWQHLVMHSVTNVE